MEQWETVPGFLGYIEEWKTIPGFLGYSASDKGRVRNDSSSRLLAILRNKNGVCYVGMMKAGIQCRRSLGPLIADRFVSRPDNERYREEFLQVIHLDGDQTNNAADNLAWRPHWFVVTYANQMKRGPRFGISKPVVDLENGYEYASTWEVATTFGLIEADLILSIMNRTYVYPTFQEFRFLPED